MWLLSLLLGLITGFVGGFIVGVFFYAKKVHKNITRDEISRETINSIIQGEEPKGDFIQVNKVQEILKNAEGDIALGDILEDDNG